MKFKLSVFLVAVLLAIAGFTCVKYYSYVFAKLIKGELTAVERVNQNETIITNGQNVPAAQIFSFAIAIRDEKGEIFTASTEDRQWAAARAGQCAEVRIFPYAPWNVEKANTYFGARLERLYDCPVPGGNAPAGTPPAGAPPVGAPPAGAPPAGAPPAVAPPPPAPDAPPAGVHPVAPPPPPAR